MLKKWLIVCSIVLSVVLTPVMAKHGSHGHNSKWSKGNKYKKDNRAHGSKSKKCDRGSKGSHGSKANPCQKNLKKMDKAYAKYEKYLQKYEHCLAMCRVDRHAKTHGSKGSKGSHGESKRCKKYKKKADKYYKAYLKYAKKVSMTCQPLAYDQNLTTNEDMSLDVLLRGLDKGHSPLQYILVTQTTDGTLTGVDANLSYAPDLNYNGIDTFTFKVNNGFLDSTIATIRIEVTPVNDAPVAIDDNVSTDEDIQLVIESLLNDSDVDSDLNKSSLAVLSLPQNGDVSINPLTGTFVYSPHANYHGVDSFTYSIKDVEGLVSNEATVDIVIKSVNDRPLAQEQNLTLAEDSNISVTLTGTDEDGDVLTYRVARQPVNGMLTGTVPNLVYTPNPNYNGADSFSFVVNDGTVDSIEATVSLVVTPVNDAPLAQNIQLITPEDTTVSTILLGNDIDGDALTYYVVTEASHGELHRIGKNITYMPTLGFYGVDSFTYMANDGTVDSNVATVTIEVLRNNVAPLAIDQNVSTEEDVSLNIVLHGVDSDNDILNYTITAQPSHGVLSGSGENLVYAPDGNYSGSDSFTFKVNDGLLDSTEALVSITVVPRITSECTDSTLPFSKIELKEKWYKGGFKVFGPVLVAQLNDDNGDGKVDNFDTPEIIFSAIYGSVSTAKLVALDGSTGNLLWKNNSQNVTGYGSGSVGDIDNDGLMEIVIVNSNRTRLLAFENDGQLKWSVPTTPRMDYIPRDAIAIADINHDGSPEIIHGRRVYTNQGVLLWEGSGDHGGETGYGIVPIVADIDMQGDMEIIADRTVYSSTGEVLWHKNNIPTRGGFTAVGNFDEDKFAEIVLVADGKVYLLEHDGTIIWGGVSIPGGGAGGAPTIGNFDDDELPEIGVAGANYYVVFDTDGSILWKSKTTDASSNRTGSSLFDFNGDGKAEVVYADEYYLRIYESDTGKVLVSKRMGSATTLEYPVIADIDNDGHAEIILGTNWNAARQGIFVLEDINDNWMPTRSIWNQHSYHISNINDDGTIPRYEEASWLTHNSYRLNSFAVNTRCQKPPKAYDASYTTLENTAKSIALLAKDINNDPLTYTLTKVPLHGTLSGTAPYFTYVPDNGYIGTDSFFYRVNDGIVDSNEANVTIIVLSSDNALIAVDDNITMEEDTNATVDVLANDSNTTGSISIAIVVAPTHGNASIVNGQILYVPNSNYNGADEFYYTYKNSNSFVSNSAKVTLNIGARNDAPVAYEQNITIAEDSLTVLTLVAIDSDGDNLSYTIVTQPMHGTLNGVTPYISYTPNKDYIGTDSFSFKAFDGNLDSNVATISVHVLPVNDAPVAIAGFNQRKLSGQEVILDAQASYDVDGNINSYLWSEGNNTLSTQVTFSKSDFTLGVHTLTLMVTDNDGLSSSSSITITILSANTPDTIAPDITLLGANPQRMNLGELYVEAGATAFDDRDGSVFVTNSRNFDGSVKGNYEVSYTASDNAGNTATVKRSVIVVDTQGEDTTPPVITLIGANPYTLIQGTPYTDPGAKVEDDRDGNIGYSLVYTVNSARVGKYIAVYRATDSAGNSAEVIRDVLVRDPNGNRAPLVYAGLDRVINVGESVTLDGSGSLDVDGDIISYAWSQNNTVRATTASFVENNLSVGIHTFILLVTDNEGASGSDTVTVRVVDPNDTTPPIALITAPAENTKVTLLTDIIGTASDVNLDYYTLSLSPVDKDTYTEFARSSASVSAGVLGSVDASTLRNGIYDIKLTAFDQNGASTTAYTKVIIDGKAKIGNFSFTVTDFNIQVGGLPVQVNRTYSTLQRFEKLDFTYAWSIDYQNVKLQENIHPGKSWKTDPDVLVGSCFRDKRQHIVNISLPDGTTERFEFKFAVECAHYFTGSFYDGPVLKPLNGTTATLSVLDASNTVMMNSYGEIIDSQTLQPYNPSLYRLTLANGMVYEIEENVGIKIIKDIRGDTLTYNVNGIQSSRGESLTFTRDAQNRITSITDLTGKTVTYHYNQNDDLDYVVDQLGQTTTYTYQEGHLLEEYFDPSGLRLAKNIYDASGRLIQTIDADGNVVEFTHNIEGNEEIVKDKLGRISLFVYDDEGNVLSQTNPLGETTLRTYDAKGNELSVTDALGYTITNTYDANDNLLETIDALGNTETTTYNAKQSPTSISDKNANTMEIVYNAYNSPRSFTTASGATNTYYYDQFGNKTQSINEYNQTTSYLYDQKIIYPLGAVSSKGNLLKETRPDGTVTTHTYDSSSNLLSSTITLADGTSTTTSSTYDAFNRMLSSTDALSQTTTYAYDARGNKVSTTDSQGRVSTYTYNNHNKVTLTSYPDNTTESKTYDAMDNMLSETNAEGETTSYTYDDADRLTSTTYADGTSTSITYDATGRTLSTTDQNANTTTYTYDAVGNRLSTTDALNNKTTFTYDAQGNMLTVTDALGQTTTYTYNALNQRVTTTYADGTSVTEAKNISGLPVVKTNEAGQTTSYGYDTSRTIPLLNQVTLANSATTTYSYDSQGKKLAQADALGHTTNWSYKATGELASETLPQGEQKTFTYDATGKQTQITDYANKAQKFIYDSYDRLVRIELADGSTTTYAYTPSRRVKSITDSQGTIANTYDAMGRLKSQTTSTGSVTATINYSYDAVGNIVEIQTPQTSISKTYDALNRLKTVTDAQGTVTYAYDAIGRQTQVTYSNGMTTNYTYDSRNQITSIEHKKSDGTVLQGFTYTLDTVGNRTSIVEHNSRRVDYTYNEVNQLTQEVVSNDPNGNNTTTTFTYDDVGNMLTKTIDTSTSSVTEDYSYNANDQLTTQGSVTFTYDANGNLVSDDTSTYSYDDKNRLINIITPTNTIEYSYDANDNRIAKTTNNGTTTYLIDANTPYAQVITENKADGTTVEYTYGNDLLSDGTHSFLTDALGSTRGLVDGSETLTDSYAYTAYGELASHDGNATNSFLFTGEQLDQETEDYYLRARYYSPNSGRFISRDTYDGVEYSPITLNHYSYANSNPIKYTDPSGMMSLAGLGGAISIRGTLAGVGRLKVPFSQFGVKKLITAGILDDGKSVVVELVVNFVIRELTGFDPDKEDPRKDKKKHNAQTGGTSAHKRLEYAIEDYKPFGNFVTLKSEVFVDINGKKPMLGKGRGATIGIDIEVWLEGKIVVLLDLKTGKRGFTNSRANDHADRRKKEHGNIPVIEIFIPFLKK
jgi:RHS repeat-associated protein